MSGATAEESVRIWVVRAGKGGSLAADCESYGLIAVRFGESGDATGLSRAELKNRFREAEVKNPAKSAAQLWRFGNEIAIGDTIVVPDGTAGELLVGRVTGNYSFQSEPVIANHPNVRGVRWSRRIPRHAVPQTALYSLGALLTVFSPSKQTELRAALLASGQAAAS